MIVRELQAEEQVLEDIANDPSSSVRKLAIRLNISKSIVHRILKDQQLYPYHVQRVHAMPPADYPAKVHYANWFLQQPAQNPNLNGYILFSDEGGFTRDGLVNSHNLHLRDEENPHAII